MLISKHKWHPEHRKILFENINGIRNIENVYLKINGIRNKENAYFKNIWHPEHRKCLF